MSVCVMLGEFKGTCDWAFDVFVRNILLACNYLKRHNLLKTKLNTTAAKYVCTNVHSCF